MHERKKKLLQMLHFVPQPPEKIYTTTRVIETLEATSALPFQHTITLQITKYFVWYWVGWHSACISFW
jgi:hypothetical protein